MSEENYNIFGTTVDRFLQAYGEEFVEQSFFEPQHYEAAKEICLDLLNEELFKDGSRLKIEKRSPSVILDLVEMLMKGAEPLLVFAREMLNFKKHIKALLGTTVLSTELQNFSRYVGFAQVSVGVVNALNNKDTHVAEIFCKTVFWEEKIDSDTMEKLKTLIALLEPSQLSLPVVNVDECSLDIADFLVWITNPTVDTMLPSQVVNAFMFINNKLTETNTCLSSSMFIQRWIQMHLSLYFRIIIVQHRLHEALRKVGVNELFSFDSSKYGERFILIGRLAAVFGFTFSSEFREQLSELRISEFFRSNHFGFLDIVFDKLSNPEYTWPLTVFGMSNRTEILDNVVVLKEAISQIKSEQLRTRLQATLENTSDYSEQQDLSFKRSVDDLSTQLQFTKLDFTEEDSTVIEPSTVVIDETPTVKIPEETSLGGWDDIVI
jgi:hypothetical protein